MTTELIVVRHGQSTWNRDRLFQGQANSSLTGLGREQAGQLAERCRGRGIEAVASSDLARAVQTGCIVTARLVLAPPVTLPGLRERWSKTLTGMSEDCIEARFPGSLAAWRDGPGTALPGESEPFEEFAARVVDALLAVSRLGSSVLVVAHAGVFRVLGQVSGTGLGAGLGNVTGRRVLVTGSDLVDGGVAFGPAPRPGTGPDQA